MTTALVILSLQQYSETERKWLHLLSKLKDNVDISLTVGFLHDSPLRTELELLKIQCLLFKGHQGLLQYLQYNRIDVIHYNSDSRLLQILNQYTGKAKIVETVLEQQKFEDISYDRVAYTIFHSQALVTTRHQSVVQFHGVNASLIFPTSKNIVKTQYALPSDVAIIGVFAYADHEIATNAFHLASVLRANHDSMHIVLYTTYRHRYLAQIQHQGLDKYISLQPVEALAAADVYLDLSDAFPVKTTALEAIVRQTPVVLPNIEANQELINSKTRIGYLYQNQKDFESIRHYCLMASRIDTSTILLAPSYLVDAASDATYQAYLPTNNAPPIDTDVIMEGPMFAADVTCYIIPYGIHGGAEVYLQNYLQTTDPAKSCLLFLSKGTVLQREMQARFRCLHIPNITALGNFLLSHKVQNVCFYNSKSIYQVLSRIKQLQPTMQITEIVHSYLAWGDSMHGVDRTSVDKILVVATTVAKQWGLTRYEVVPPKINETRFSRPRTFQPKITIGTVARFSTEKNLNRVVDIAATFDDSYRFVIIGQDGGSKNALQAYIKKKGLVRRVILKDYNPKIEEEYSTFDAFLLTSTIEGTPLTILEALAAGVPVIAPDVGAIREMLTGKNAYVYNPEESNYVIGNEIRKLMPRAKGDKLLADTSVPLVPIQSAPAPIQTDIQYDFLILSHVDSSCFFQACELFQSVLTLAGKRVHIINGITSMDPTVLDSYIKKSKCVILYRHPLRPPQIPKCILDIKGIIPIGYMIDDDYYYSERDDVLSEQSKSAVREFTAWADFCLTTTQSLAEVASKFNKNTFWTSDYYYFWETILQEKGIDTKIAKNEEGDIRLGIIAGVSYHSHVHKYVEELVDFFDKKSMNVTLVYFAKQPLQIVSKNVKFEYHEYIAPDNVKLWYNVLFKLRLDLVFVRYPNHPLTKSKSNLKFRESAFMKIPLIAVDPTSSIYSDQIINGDNGYCFSNMQDALQILEELLTDKERISKMGESAHRAYDVSPFSRAQKLNSILEQILNRVGK